MNERGLSKALAFIYFQGVSIPPFQGNLQHLIESASLQIKNEMKTAAQLDDTDARAFSGSDGLPFVQSLWWFHHR